MTRRQPTPGPTVSSAMEDYLKAIYELGGADVKTQELADALSLRAASVTGMIKKLGDLKLVEHRPYRGVSLTGAGRKIALETVRHHRLIETYLAEALGYALHEVHEEAEKLEHHISEDFEARIAALLGHPSFDPHGDPIPSPDGSLPEVTGAPLPTLPEGERLRVTRVTLQTREALVALAERNVVPGRELVLIARGGEGRPAVVEIDGRRVGLSPELAGAVFAVALCEEA